MPIHSKYTEFKIVIECIDFLNQPICSPSTVDFYKSDVVCDSLRTNFSYNRWSHTMTKVATLCLAVVYQEHKNKDPHAEFYKGNKALAEWLTALNYAY